MQRGGRFREVKKKIGTVDCPPGQIKVAVVERRPLGEVRLHHRIRVDD